MTATCAACGYVTTTSSCPRCGFAAPVELAKTRSGPVAADTALFDATVARPTVSTFPAATPSPDPYGGWPTTAAPDHTHAAGPAPWDRQPPPSGWQGSPPPHRPSATSQSVVSTVFAHLVLWVGTLVVAAGYNPLVEALYADGPADRTTGAVVLGVFELLPVASALAVAGRGATLRVIGLVGGVAVLGASVFLRLQSYDVDTWPVSVALCVLGLATWITARRHARLGYLTLLPAVILAMLWFPSFGPGRTLQSFPYAHGVTSSILLNLWSFLPLVAIGALGLVSSLLRPVPPRDRDAVGWAVVGPLVLVVVILMPVVRAVSGPTPDYSGGADGAAYSSGSSTPDYSSSTAPDPAAAASAYFDAAQQGQTSVAGCNGDVSTPSVASYTIGQVSPSTSGGFDVSATVVAADGSTQVVTVRIGASSIDNQSCVDAASIPGHSGAGGADQAGGGFPVPSVPASTDPVPSGTTVPVGTVGGSVIPYSDSSRTPTTAAELVAYRPEGLSSDQTAAVQSLIRFLTAVNQQDFQSAWEASTYVTRASTYSSGFAGGYATSRHFEVSFGQPQQLTSTLIAVPATFVSRQDPAAQGNPSGVTGCTYWPQYVFLAANVGGAWLDDTAGVFSGDPSVLPLKRADPSRPGKIALNPLSQRVAC